MSSSPPSSGCIPACTEPSSARWWRGTRCSIAGGVAPRAIRSCSWPTPTSCPSSSRNGRTARSTPTWSAKVTTPRSTRAARSTTRVRSWRSSRRWRRSPRRDSCRRTTCTWRSDTTRRPPEAVRAAIVAALAGRSIRPALVLDEGGAVVEGAVPGVSAPTAMVGVAERGVMTVQLTAREAGGHASTPPALPATVRLARAIEKLHRRPFPRRLSPPVRAMLATVAPHASEPYRWIFGNLAVTAPAVAAALSAGGPELNAIVRTTAVATELSGAPSENVLATAARASVNVRLLTGDTVDAAVDHIRRAIGDPEIAVEVRHASEPSPVSPWRGEAWRRIATAVRDVLGPDVITTPYLQLGASDSRWFTEISDHVYRFTPFSISRAERDALHANDERIRVGSWLRGIEVYRALLRAS
ncbi:hypothetical protein LUZ63_021641 [Rhynchospora breviuscula]|uniref:Peptidase M20 dimerisation domain-containing protein n=1 Tax=Rhynchospora breviuscula TaxID=2022672 RepID=A0A9P9Z6B8_9POAL|nr:hypothetical protein LUZ63_021641 [Rhynchospora breviuscula]